MTPLEKSIISTISYFDIFDYPLTAMEVWKWLYAEAAASSVGAMVLFETLEHSPYVRRHIQQKNGYYFLAGRERIVETRTERYGLAEKKYYRAKRVIRWLRWLPFVRMVGICSSLAYNNSRTDGDIDLLIVSAAGRIWQTRFWVTGFLKLAGLRPAPGRTRDTICPSYFIDEQHLNVHKLAREQDIHVHYLVMQVAPLYDEGVYTEYLQANNWVRQRLPNTLPMQLSSRRFVKPVPPGIKAFVCGLARILPERLFRWLEMKIMPERLTTIANTDTRVVIDDTMLKLHDNDRRQQVNTLFQEAMHRLPDN